MSENEVISKIREYANKLYEARKINIFEYVDIIALSNKKQYRAAALMIKAYNTK